MVIYCPLHDEKMIREARGNLPLIIVTRYQTADDFGTERNLRQEYGEHFWRKHALSHPGTVRVDRNLKASAVWNSKAYMASMVAYCNPFGSDVIQYTDVGGFRPIVFPAETPVSWPHWNTLLDAITLSEGKRVLISSIKKHWDDGFFYRELWFQGTWFAGTPAVIREYARQYYTEIDDSIQNGHAIINDEHVVMRTVQKHPTNFAALTNDLSDWDQACAGTWRVFIHQLASEEFQSKNRCSLLSGKFSRRFTNAEKLLRDATPYKNTLLQRVSSFGLSNAAMGVGLGGNKCRCFRCQSPLVEIWVDAQLDPSRNRQQNSVECKHYSSSRAGNQWRWW